MNILFLTIIKADIDQRGIYYDLMRKFRDDGHCLYVVSPVERKYNRNTSLRIEKGVHILEVRSLNLLDTNLIEKGLAQFSLGNRFYDSIRHYFPDISFDLVLYSTPPITFQGIVYKLKKLNPNLTSYLMLKDIFPQNALDLGILKKWNPIYHFYRKQEKRLYKVSDYIGCMSPANKEYLLKNNPELPHYKVEIAPNSIELTDNIKANKEGVRKKYGLPVDKPIFLYGGSINRPQGIEFIIDCLKSNSHRNDCIILVVGFGYGVDRVKEAIGSDKDSSVIIMNGLPKREYDELASACDVGMIFLDYRFTIPNYPSRLLPYLENKMPVICATDPNTDVGKIAEENGYGYWCESNSVVAFTTMLDKMINSDIQKMGNNGYEFLKINYLVENTYSVIMSHV